MTHSVKWYYRRWFIYLMLGIAGPLALLWLWRSPHFSKRAKWIWTAAVVIGVLLLAVLSNQVIKMLETEMERIGSVEGRILPSVRKFKELGATGAEEIPPLEPIEQSPRQLETVEPVEQ